MAHPAGSARLRGYIRNAMEADSCFQIPARAPSSRKAVGTSRSPRVHEVTVSQHGRSAPNGCALHGGDQRLLEIDQRADQLRLRTFVLCWRVLHKVLDIIARTKRISRSMPQHDAYLLVFCRSVE